MQQHLDVLKTQLAHQKATRNTMRKRNADFDETRNQYAKIEVTQKQIIEHLLNQFKK